MINKSSQLPSSLCDYIYKAKENVCIRIGGLVGDTNMAAVPLFRDTNMAAVTSRENTELFVKLPLE